MPTRKIGSQTSVFKQSFPQFVFKKWLLTVSLGHFWNSERTTHGFSTKTNQNLFDCKRPPGDFADYEWQLTVLLCSDICTTMNFIEES